MINSPESEKNKPIDSEQSSSESSEENKDDNESEKSLKTRGLSITMDKQSMYLESRFNK